MGKDEVAIIQSFREIKLSLKESNMRFDCFRNENIFVYIESGAYITHIVL